MAVAAPPDLKTTWYAEEVVAGRVLAGPLVRLACARHLRDLDDGGTRGLHFDDGRAAHIVEFFPRFLRLTEGAHAQQPFVLEPWQQFIVGSLFGWLGHDGYRRFRKAYVETSKGQGKTPMGAAIGLYGLTADGEVGAEIYMAATMREQAAIPFRDAKHMVESSPELRSRIEINVGNLAYLPAKSFLRPVSSEARGLDGKRVHMALIDELHEHPTDVVVEKMQAGTKGRRAPLVLAITNAGYDRHSVCWTHHDYSAKVLHGVIEDDGWFAYVCGLDPCVACRADGHEQPQEGCAACDDWRDEAVWEKANPNLGISVTKTYLREQVREAEGMPSKANIVKRLNFCIWSESVTRWLPLGDWDACGQAAVDAEALRGRTCYAGLDLSSTSDLSALVLVFPPVDEEDGYDVLCRFWVPGDNVRPRAQRDRVPYPLWVEQGHLAATEGNVVDYNFIRAAINALGERYALREIAIDRWNSTQLQVQLQGDGFAVIPFGQGFGSMTAPCKELEKLVRAHHLRHGGHPVLRWMAANVVIEQNAAGDIKPSKGKSTEKIDGIVALVMALDRAMRRAAAGRSRWETEGEELVTVP